MPVQIDGRAKFLEAISNIAEHRKQEIIEEVAQKKKDSLEREELKILKESYEFIQTEIQRNRNEIISEYSRKEIEEIDALIQKRNSMEESVFKAVTDKIAEFTESSCYEDFLMESARQMSELLGEGSKLMIRPCDTKLSPLIRNAFGKDCTVEADEAIVLGGMIGEDAALGLAANDSLDDRLEAQREWFRENSALYYAD